MNNSQENLTQTIKNSWIITLRGVLLILFGISLFMYNSSMPNITLALSILPILAGVFGLYYLQKNVTIGLLTVKNWLKIESVGDIILGIVFFYLFLKDMDSINTIRTVFASFAMFYCFMQFTFIFQVAMSGFRGNALVAIIRAVTAVGYGLFAVILFYKDDTSFLINIIGLGPIISGIAYIRLLGYKINK